MAKHLLAKLALVILCAGLGSAQAATATGTFQVKITITESCTVTAGSGSDIDLGSHVRSATGNFDNTNNISVNCSSGTPYKIGLKPSNNNNLGAGVLTLSPNTIPYQLYSNSGYSTIWGDTDPNRVSAVGTGSAQTIAVYARVVGGGNTNVPAGVYVDTVTVTVTY